MVGVGLGSVGGKGFAGVKKGRKRISSSDSDYLALFITPFCLIGVPRAFFSLGGIIITTTV